VGQKKGKSIGKVGDPTRGKGQMFFIEAGFFFLRINKNQGVKNHRKKPVPHCKLKTLGPKSTGEEKEQM